MKWEDERYVRLFIRDTATWKLLPWQAKAILPLLMRKLDRFGCVQVGSDVPSAVALTTDLPLEIAAVAVPALVELNVICITEGELVMHDFIQSQEAVASPRLRAELYREKARSQLRPVTKRDDSVTKRDDPSRNVTTVHRSVTKRDDSVTKRDDPSRNVTTVHRSVTKRDDRSLVSRASDPDLDPPVPPVPPDPIPPDPPAPSVPPDLTVSQKSGSAVSKRVAHRSELSTGAVATLGFIKFEAVKERPPGAVDYLAFVALLASEENSFGLKLGEQTAQGRPLSHGQRLALDRMAKEREAVTAAQQSASSRPSGKALAETELPDGWAPMEEHRALATELGFDADKEALKFTDHALARGRRYRDWNAAFRSWLRNSKDFGSKGRISERESTLQQNAAEGEYDWRYPEKYAHKNEKFNPDDWEDKPTWPMYQDNPKLMLEKFGQAEYEKLLAKKAGAA